jgi:hypothetical protein
MLIASRKMPTCLNLQRRQTLDPDQAHDAFGQRRFGRLECLKLLPGIGHACDYSRGQQVDVPLVWDSLAKSGEKSSLPFLNLHFLNWTCTGSRAALAAGGASVRPVSGLDR